MSRPSLASRRDPYWDMDGAGARRTRNKRRFVRYGVVLVGLLVLGLVAVRLPSIDPDFLIRGDGRPLLAGALLTLLASSVLLGLAKIRHTVDQ